MVDDDRVLRRDLIEVLRVQRAIVLQLGIVEEIALNPGARRRRLGSGAQLIDDALNGDELDVVRVAYKHVIEQPLAAPMIVRVDESRHDRHLLGVVHLNLFANESSDLFAASHRDEPATLDRKRLRLRLAGIDRVYLGVEDDEIGSKVTRCVFTVTLYPSR
jgi:hypothetical protein